MQAKTEQTKTYSIQGALFCLVVPPLVCFGLLDNHQAASSVFLTVVLLWFTEVVPLAATGIGVPVLIALYGVLPATKAFEPFGSDILFLFLGCFFLTRAMQKHSWDKRMTYFIFSRSFVGGSLLRVSLLTATLAFILSMWISNTATAAIMVAICLGIINHLKGELEPTIWKRFSLRLMFTCAFASSIGGLATPVGSPPNLIAIDFLRQAGIDISFLEWVYLACPIAIVIFLLLLVFFEFRFPLHGITLPSLQEHFRPILSSMGRLSTSEIQVAVVFICTVFLWIVPDLAILLFPENELAQLLKARLTISVVGIGGALVLFFLPLRYGYQLRTNLEWSDAKYVDWGTLMLFGGGLCLGRMLEQSGLAAAMGTTLLYPDEFGIIFTGLTVLVFMLIMTEFASNTASAAIVIPILLGSLSSGSIMDIETVETIVLAATFTATLGFMLPVSTPPNAIVYGTGTISARELLKCGAVLDLLGLLVIGGFLVLSL